jgi:hypothetical protein
VEPALIVADAQTLSPTVAVEGSAAHSWELALEGARPNPAVGGLRVHFTLASGERAVLELMDVAGRRVARREVGSLGPGRHSVVLAPAHARQGLYFVRLSQGGRALTARAVLVR